MFFLQAMVDLQKSLSHKDLLRILNRRRHLIVHRRGIIDGQYLDRTGDTAKRLARF